MTTLPSRPIALVTGANRGIGLEVCRQLAEASFDVVLCSRDPVKGEQAAATLRAQGLSVVARQLDVSDPASVTAARRLARGRARRPRRPRQQRRHQLRHLAGRPQRRSRYRRPDLRHQHPRALAHHARVSAAPAPQRPPARRQRLQRCRRLGRHDRLHARLQPLQARAQRPHPHARQPPAPRSHPRQRRLPRLGCDRHGRLPAAALSPKAPPASSGPPNCPTAAPPAASTATAAPSTSSSEVDSRLQAAPPAPPHRPSATRLFRCSCRPSGLPAAPSPHPPPRPPSRHFRAHRARRCEAIAKANQPGAPRPAPPTDDPFGRTTHPHLSLRGGAQPTRQPLTPRLC